MRIAYVVDVHGRFAVVNKAAAAIGPVDALIVGGDITTAGTPADAQEAIAGWQSLAPRLLAVAGNMDSAAIDARLVELGISIDGRGVMLGHVGVFGASAAPVSPLRTPHELTEYELERRIEQGYAEVAGARLTIFCPHAPPLDTACDRLPDGRHVGSAAVRSFVERAQPDVVLCGHIHESRGRDELGRSQIVNPGPAPDGHYAVVDVGDRVAVTLDGE